MIGCNGMSYQIVHLQPATTNMQMHTWHALQNSFNSVGFPRPTQNRLDPSWSSSSPAIDFWLTYFESSTKVTPPARSFVRSFKDPPQYPTTNQFSPAIHPRAIASSSVHSKRTDRVLDLHLTNYFNRPGIGQQIKQIECVQNDAVRSTVTRLEICGRHIGMHFKEKSAQEMLVNGGWPSQSHQQFVPHDWSCTRDA